MTLRLAGLPVVLGLLLTCSKVGGDEWASWGDTRSAIEYSSLLSGWSIDPKNNRITFETKLALVAVYLPTTPMYFVKAELWRAGGARKLHFWDFELTPNPSSYPFLKIKPRAEKPFAFTDAGDYVLKFWARDPRVPQGVYITHLEFQVEFLNDPQKPKPVAVLSGPWDNWAYLWFPYGARENGRPQLRIWRRADLSTKPEGDEYTVRILKKNMLLAVSEPKTVTGLEHSRLDFPLSLPENLGGSELLAKDLLAQVGEYHVLVEKNGKPDGAYTFEVEHRPRLTGTQYSVDPAFVFHKNQKPVDAVLEDFIVPRMPGDNVEREGAGDTVWMERMSTVEAALAFNQKTPDTGVPNPSTTPLVKPVVVTESMDPAEKKPSENPMPREVATLTVKDTEKLHVIPLPMDNSPNDPPSKPEEQTTPEPAKTETTPAPAETLKTEDPPKRTTRLSSDENPDFAPDPPLQRPTIWESHLGLIATIFAAHLAVGLFCSYKILKAA